MPPYSDLSVRQLKNKLKLLEQRIYAEIPELIDEKRVIENVIERKERDETTEFVGKSGLPAIHLAFEINPVWMTHEEMYAFMKARGYNPENQLKPYDTLRDLLGYHSNPKKDPKKSKNPVLRMVGDKFGLKDWSDPIN